MHENEDWPEARQYAEDRVRDVLGSFRAELRTRPNDEDLITSRQVDSLTFVSIVNRLIETSGRIIDLESTASAEMRSIQGLARVFFGPLEGNEPAGISG